MNDLTSLINVQNWEGTIPTTSWLLIVIVSLVAFLTIVISYRQRAAESAITKWLVPLANLFSFALIIVLILDFTLDRENQSELVLLTKGYQSAEGRLKGSEEVVAIVSAFDESELSSLPDETSIVESAIDLVPLLKSHPNLRVLGDGLSEQQWLDIERLTQAQFSVRWEPSSAELGLINATWPKNTFVGQETTFSARLQVPNNTDALYEVIVVEPSGQVLDSTTVRADEQFSLSFRPKIEGRWLYSIQLKQLSDESVTVNEPVAIDVQNAKSLNVIIKQSSPSFETRHLQNWLGQYGHTVTVLTQISREKHLVQKINVIENGPSSPKATLQQGLLSQDQLSNVDFVIIDGRAFTLMNAEQHELLSRAVTKGLGVLVLVDESFNNYLNDETTSQIDMLRGFSLSPHEEPNQFDAPKLVNWSNSQAQLPIKISPYLLSGRHSDSLAYDEEGHSVLAKTNLGKGHIALSLINQSYQWRTSGELDSYSQYWQSILLSIARVRNANYWVAENDSPSLYKNDHHSVCAVIDPERSSDFIAESISPTIELVSIALNQASLNETVYCSVNWVRASGWYKFNLYDQEGKLLDTQNKYSYDNHNWAVELQRQMHAATEKMRIKYDDIISLSSSRLIEKWPLALLLLFCLSYLWIERKLR